MASKIRADQLLVQLGLAESRTRAQALILAGQLKLLGKGSVGIKHQQEK